MVWKKIFIQIIKFVQFLVLVVTRLRQKSNVETLRIDICSSCHPFFTGEQKIVDAAGRVEKFKAKYAMAK